MSTNYTFTVPTLETERLLLRGWKESDAEGVSEIYGDEDTAHFIGGYETPENCWRIVCQRIGQWSVRGYSMFAIEEKATGEFVGYAGPHFPAGWPEREIGWSLIKRFHGLGYATEAAHASLRFAYQTLGWDTAMSLVDAMNTPSAKVAMRLGAKFERTEKVTNFTADVYRHLPPSEFLNS